MLLFILLGVIGFFPPYMASLSFSCHSCHSKPPGQCKWPLAGSENVASWPSREASYFENLKEYRSGIGKGK